MARLPEVHRLPQGSGSDKEELQRCPRRPQSACAELPTEELGAAVTRCISPKRDPAQRFQRNASLLISSACLGLGILCKRNPCSTMMRRPSGTQVPVYSYLSQFKHPQQSNRNCAAKSPTKNPATNGSSPPLPTYPPSPPVPSHRSTLGSPPLPARNAWTNTMRATQRQEWNCRQKGRLVDFTSFVHRLNAIFCRSSI